MDIILPKNYAIKFNAKFIPSDFDKWNKLDTSGYEKNSILKLNYYKSIIIKSKEEHILLQIGGCNSIIKQNLIYFPFFPLYHEINLTLSPNIDIYTNPICKFNENTGLNKIMIYNCIIFCGLEIIDVETNKPIETIKYLLSADGMCGLTMKKYIEFDIEKFYYEYEKVNEENNIDKEKIVENIYLIDKYYQSDAIKICKFI